MNDSLSNMPLNVVSRQQSIREMGVNNVRTMCDHHSVHSRVVCVYNFFFVFKNLCISVKEFFLIIQKNLVTFQFSCKLISLKSR